MSIVRFSVISSLLPHQFSQTQGSSLIPIKKNDPVSANSQEKGQEGTQVIERTEVRLPKLQKVIMHNDDYTTMEFVIAVLKRFFHKSEAEAQSLMMKVHQDGKATCGIFTKEVAESKIIQVTRYAKENGHPLRLSMEEE